MSAQITEQTAEIGRPLLLRAWRWWEKAGSVLAIFGLADVFGQFIKWAGFIHWLVSKYSAAKAWVFSWLPFRIPPDWQDPIVLLLVLFSVTNIGFYQRTGRTYARHLLVWAGSLLLLMVMWPLFPLLIFSKRFRQYIASVQALGRGDKWLASDPMAKTLLIAVGLCLAAFLVTAVAWRLVDERGIPLGPEHAGFLIVGMIAANILLAGGAVAWRWILGTGAAFAALVVVNYLYVNYLVPFVQ